MRKEPRNSPTPRGFSASAEVGTRITVATSEISAKPASTAPRQQVKSGAKVLQIFTRLSWIFTHGSSHALILERAILDELMVDLYDLIFNDLIFNDLIFNDLIRVHDE